AGLAGSYGNDDGIGSAARFNSPSGIAIDTAGNIYVGDLGNRAIRKITPAGVVTTLASQSTSFFIVTPFGVAVDSAGYIYVGDFFTHTVLKVTPAGQVSPLGGSYFNPGNSDGTGEDARFSYPY